MNHSKRDRRRDQHVYVDDLRVGDVIYDDTGEATVVSVSDIDQRGYRNIEVAINGGRKTFRYYGESTVPIKRRAGGVREGHRVADFNTLEDLIAHAATDLGATHVSGHGAETRIYFPLDGGQYEEATVWQKGGYWHALGPSARQHVRGLPRNAKFLPGDTEGSRGRQRHHVRDYEAVDNHDRHIAGPFKSYGDARQAAGTAGVVKFVPSRGKAGRATEARESISRDKIQSALALVHSNGNDASAARHAIINMRLNDTEIDILLNAIHMRRSEVEPLTSQIPSKGRSKAEAPRHYSDISAAIESWNRGDAYRDGSLQTLIETGLVAKGPGGWAPTASGYRRGLGMDHLGHVGPREAREASRSAHHHPTERSARRR